MPYPDFFSSEATQPLMTRMGTLQAADKPLWGKMNAGQMLAHINVTFQLALEPNPKRPPLLVRGLLQLLFKRSLINDKPLKKGGRTAPELIIQDARDFEKELSRFYAFVQQVQADGGAAFVARKHPAFGTVSKQEWSNMMYKHIDHHLRQFGK